jgi:lysylphosphatidylglycerol synthetase-like protein (DUF2156 family)
MNIIKPLVCEVQKGQRLMILAHLALTTPSSESSVKLGSLTSLCAELRKQQDLDTLIFAGNLFDLTLRTNSDLLDIVRGHQELFDTLAELRNHLGTRFILIPGTLDAKVADAPDLLEKAVETYVEIELASSVTLRLESGVNPQELLITSDAGGYGTKDENSIAQTEAAVRQVTKKIADEYKVLHGADRLENTNDISAFVVSRLIYRRGLRYLPLALAPIFVALALKIPLVLTLPLLSRLKSHRHLLNHQLFTVGANTLVDAFVISILYLIFARKIFRSLERATETVLEEGDSIQQLGLVETEAAARGLISSRGFSPSLISVGENSFLASPGSVGSSYRRFHTRLGLPDTFLEVGRCSWLEISVYEEFYVRLMQIGIEARTSWFTRLLLKDSNRQAKFVEVLATHPGGKNYPQVGKATRNDTYRARRISYVALTSIGFLELLSSFTPPLRARIHAILALLPSVVSNYANSATALIGVATISLAAGVRRGSRRAWALTIAAIAAGVVSNLIKGGDLEESFLLILAGIYLFANRRSFQAAPAKEQKRILRAARPLFAVLFTGVFSVEGFYALAKRQLLPIGTVFFATVERMVGVATVNLDPDLNRIITPALTYTGIATLGIVAYTLFNPLVSSIAHDIFDSSSANDPFSLVRMYGNGTLDYFALRDDKTHFVERSTLIAYSVFGSTCVVSPDPVGPKGVREMVFEHFLSDMKRRGLSIAVLGASAEWIDTYQSLGLHPYYIGDEAIVEAREIPLLGKANKSLRQAVNRMKKYGYTVELIKSSSINDNDKDDVLRVLSESRRGGVERGFSMTLGRIFDPRDKDLLLSICRSKEGRIVGFCQWVPTNHGQGYSLDLMRREIGEHPNGMMDLLIVETLSHLSSTEVRYLSLNFAALRATLAGERGGGLSQRMERWALERLSDSMQIESLWRFNSKFNPTWAPRYLIYDNVEDIPNVAIAIARAESLWDIPLIGRLIMH